MDSFTEEEQARIDYADLPFRIYPTDLKLMMNQTDKSRDVCFKALLNNRGDILKAIIALK